MLRYDQRGFGLSEKPTGDMTMDQHVGDLLALLDALKIDRPVVLAGVAVGAGIAMAFSAGNPDRVSHLLALAPACGVATEARTRAFEMARRIADNGLRREASGLFETAYSGALRNDPERYAQYRLAWLSSDARSLAAIYRMLATQDLDAELEKLPASTVLVGGTYDVLRPEAEIRRLAALCPHATAVFAPTGHFMQVNSPHFVAFLLREFVRDAPGIEAAYRSFVASPAHRYGEEGPLR